MLKRVLLVLTATALLAAMVTFSMGVASAQSNSDDTKLTLHPSGFGKKSYAAWKAKEGQQDSKGNADHALYLQKDVPTATLSAGVGIVKGLEGEPVSGLTGLEWEHRNDGHCGAGAPRWNVGVTGASGQNFTLFLGCAGAVHSPGSEPGWTRDTYLGPAIVTTGAANAGLTPAQVADVQAGTIRGLAIVFDEGNDVGPGYVYLDNIKVNDHVWTAPRDNGNNS